MAVAPDNFHTQLARNRPFDANHDIFNMKGSFMSDLRSDEDFPHPPGMLRRSEAPTLMPPPPPARWLQPQGSNTKTDKIAPPVSRTPEPPVADTWACQTVEVIGLPKKLMSTSMLQAILEQGGFEAEMLDFKILQVDKTQVLRISLASLAAAQRCVEHFDGRKWSAAAGGVSARVVTSKAQDKPAPPPAPKPRSSGAKVAAPSKGYNVKSEPKIPGLQNELPLYVHSGLAKEMIHWGRADNSDASTNVSDEEVHQEFWGPQL